VSLHAKIDPAIPASLREAVITRTFDAPRDLVWQAWTKPVHLQAWWGPHGFDAVNPTVDLRVGGEMRLDMRAPDGTILPGTGVIREFKAPEKLVVSTIGFEDADGIPQFEALNTITLAEEGPRTKLTLHIEVIRASLSMIDGLKGMQQGWTETLIKMAEHLDLVRWQAGTSTRGTAFVLPRDRPVVVIRRTFDAPRELVWRALTDPKMRAEWWGPTGLKTNVREMDVRVGGTWRIDHIEADGTVHAFWGEYTEVRPPMRLVNTFRFGDFPPAVETITLAEEKGQTTLTNVTAVEKLELRKGWVETGMEKGAHQSMERLEALLARMKLGARADDAHRAFAQNHMDSARTERKITHATFVVERTFDASPRTVFGAFADEKAKDKWFVGPPDWDVTEKSMDFRVGGREVNKGGPKGGPISSFDAHYYDIVPNERIVYAYEMCLDDKRISVSVATIEFKPAGRGTRLVLTEQGAFLDGFDNPALREEGTRELIEALARSLNKSAAA
jgi:uncharacterized protein YndB with AHSA1/START domain